MSFNLIGGQGALSILSGINTTGQRSGGVDAASQVRLTIAQAEQNARNNQIAASVTNRFRGIAEGLIEPDPNREFEQVGGFLTITGQPFIMTVNQSGQVDVQAQKEIENSPLYSQAQLRQLREGASRLEELVAADDLNKTKLNFAATLTLASQRTEDLLNFAPATELWEISFNAQRSTGTPTKLVLDGDGNVQALNQLEHDFVEVENETDRQTLLQAARDLQNIFSGAKAATELWQYEVIGKKADGVDYFIDLDKDGEIVIRDNRDTVSAATSSVVPGFLNTLINPAARNFDNLAIIPDFLNDRPELSFNAKWEEEAIDLYKNNRPFYLDPVGTGFQVRELNFNTVNLLSQRLNSSSDTLVRNSLVNLLA